jgi:hypothetical protein
MCDSDVFSADARIAEARAVLNTPKATMTRLQAIEAALMQGDELKCMLGE